MKLSYKEYLEITISLEQERDKAKHYIEQFPDDCDFWKEKFETLSQILKKIEKPRTKAYQTGLPA